MVITILYTSSQLIRLFGLEEPRLQITTETFGKQVPGGQKQNYGLKTWIPLNFIRCVQKRTSFGTNNSIYDLSKGCF